MSSTTKVLWLRITAVVLALASVIAAVCGVGAWMVSGCCGSPEPSDDSILVIGAMAAVSLWFLAYQCHAEATRRARAAPEGSADLTSIQRSRYLRVITVTLVLPGAGAMAWGVHNWWDSGCCGSPERQAAFLLVGGLTAGCLWSLAWWCVVRGINRSNSSSS